MKYPFNLLTQFNKQDLSYIMVPLLSLLGFILLGFLIFPKPSKIYRDGVLKECSCIGVKASPRNTQGVGVGETYCLGVPYKCVKTQVMKK